MNNAKNRNTAANFSGMPTVDDARLVQLLLTLPLGATFRAELLTIQPLIEPGKFGQLTKADRDRWMRLATDAGLLKRVTPDAKKGIHISMNSGTYEQRRVRGTDVAEALPYQSDGKPRPIPLPPPRIVAALKAKRAPSERRSA